jgi:hypothetical protein
MPASTAASREADLEATGSASHQAILEANEVRPLAKMTAKRDAGYKALGYGITKAQDLFSRADNMTTGKIA